MTDSTGQSPADHEGTYPEHRCVDCDLPVPYSTDPCPRCAQYVCDKCFDGTEGMCLACPKRGQEQKDLTLPVTYEMLARKIAESENRVRYDQMMKRKAFEERVQLQYRKELNQIRNEVAELFSNMEVST